MRTRTYNGPSWRSTLSRKARSLAVSADGLSAAREEKARVRPMMAAAMSDMRRSGFIGVEARELGWRMSSVQGVARGETGTPPGRIEAAKNADQDRDGHGHDEKL